LLKSLFASQLHVDNGSGNALFKDPRPRTDHQEKDMAQRQQLDDIDIDDDTITLPFVRTPEGIRPPTAADAARRRQPTRASSPATVVRDALWDANDVAAYLKVSRSGVYHRAEAGLLPHVRVGGLLRFDPEVVRAYARK
jgi:excisionase family DNA binding protein